ncbi:unnamed protein product [Orchesella dallaii]|uniref:Uncharacterized protein n=1 Tax=Orchesella dallaii TaxID=48710 RepID=A0ABP1R9P1_9HEXA
MGRSQQEAYKNNNPTSMFNHPPQQQPILGGGILSISGSTSNAAAAAASMNPPMALVSGDDGSGGASTTVLSLPPGAVTVNPRGGIDISWRNPYHVPGSSVSRCRAYSRDFPSSFGAGPSVSSSRGTRGRRPSSSSSSGLGRNSIATAAQASNHSNHSQNATIETPEGMTDRSTRSEHTSFDRDTITPQRSLSLTSPETGGDQSSRVTSGRPSLENDPSWACTKRVGLTLCFLAFILLGTVGAKFMIQGPGVIDTSRTGKAEAAAYFLFTELIFVAFAMALFFTGVACLRKRTNDYLLRQFNQYILNTSATPGAAGGAMGGIPGQDAYDFEYYDGGIPPSASSMIPGAGSPNRNPHHHHHHHAHHGGFHNYRHQRSVGSLMEEGDYGEGDLASPPNFHGAGPIHYPPHYNGSNGGNSSRHGRSKPPPYHIALYLPLPEGMGGGSSPEESRSGNNNYDQDGNKSSKSGDAIGFIDSSSVKDAQDAGAVVNYSGSNSNDNRDSNADGNGDGNHHQDNRSETPPPPYEQL